MATAKRAKLTDLDLKILHAAARNDGSLYRSERGYDLYDSYLVTFSRATKINRQVAKLAAGEPQLLKIGEAIDLRRSWLLTDAGRQVIADNPGPERSR